MLSKREDEGLTWGTTKDSALLTYLEQSREDKYKEILDYLQQVKLAINVWPYFCFI